MSMILEDAQNASNWNKLAAIGDVPVFNKRKRFLASKIHKLKKILKMGSKAFRKHNSVAAFDTSLEDWQNHQNSIEEQMQNYENELLEKQLAKQSDNYEHQQNISNENWENWDSCCSCTNPCSSIRPPSPPPPYTDVPQFQPQPRSQHSSICYVFMPGQQDPVPVKLRNAKIPGGVMWIVYRPDLDICHRDSANEITTYQIAQAQRPILV